jgi:hypothetical protein
VDDDEAMTDDSGGSRGVGRCRRATAEALQWGLPLTSTPMVIGLPSSVCGHNERWILCPRHAPPFIWYCTRGGPLPQEQQAPAIRARIGIDSHSSGDRGVILP